MPHPITNKESVMALKNIKFVGSQHSTLIDMIHGTQTIDVESSYSLSFLKAALRLLPKEMEAKVELSLDGSYYRLTFNSPEPDNLDDLLSSLGMKRLSGSLRELRESQQSQM